MAQFDPALINKLKAMAKQIRCDSLVMIQRRGSGHPGGSLSAADILAALYGHHLNTGPDKVNDPNRDRFILSKGHASFALYAALAARGYFEKPLTEMSLEDLRLQGHPDRTKTPGVEMSTGSLGQGLSVAVGMALGGKLDNASYRVYALLGDGEIAEGQVWEAALAAAHYKLDNLTAIVDHNGLQIMGPTRDVFNTDSLGPKWESFGWNVREVDGHDIEVILDALDSAGKVNGKPTAIIAHTIKGKGVSFMEGQVAWHGKAPSREELDLALAELGCPKEGACNE